MQRVAFDTWAWFEVLTESTTGSRLTTAYLDAPDVRVLTPSLALAEMSATLARHRLADRIEGALTSMDAGSEIVHLSVAAAAKVGPLLLDLRRARKDASMADAVMLATARDHGAVLVSRDRAYQGQPDVVRP